MLTVTTLVYSDSDQPDLDSADLFESIANDIYHKGYSVKPGALPMELASELWQHLQQMPDHIFDTAGIGREAQHNVNQFIRTDAIAWITGESTAGRGWLKWANELQGYLNRRLFLGLFSFESHFAHYAPGDFYKRHFDAFKGEANRRLSLVVYLNSDWMPEDGGELVIYRNETETSGLKVTPGFGTLVAFLSEEFPHEVLPAQRDRYSIAGWFRINSSVTQRVDPPK